MTKKHYIAIAKILNEYKTNQNARDIECIAIRLADYFKSENANFDNVKFIDAVNKELTK